MHVVSERGDLVPYRAVLSSVLFYIIGLRFRLLILGYQIGLGWVGLGLVGLGYSDTGWTLGEGCNKGRISKPVLIGINLALFCFND